MQCFIIIFLLSTVALAQEKFFTGESEASSVVLSGTTNTETYSAKTKNTFLLNEKNSATVFGKYLRSVLASTETAKAWEAGLRYERIFTKDLLSAFLQHKAEHDLFNGIFLQRDSTDVGLKYVITKSDDLEWFAEVGYRYSSTLIDSSIARTNASFARIYTEASCKLSPTTSGKIWAEHLSNLTKTNESQSNAEVSLAVTMTDIFSLKTSYLYNRNEATAAPAKKDTTTWTTALVAKY